MTLGGRAAEEVVFGEITTGAANDLEKATTTAKQMIMRYGMSEELGPRTLGHNQALPFLGREFSQEPDYSEEVARQIDAEIRRIIEEAHERATRSCASIASSSTGSRRSSSGARPSSAASSRRCSTACPRRRSSTTRTRAPSAAPSRRRRGSARTGRGSPRSSRRHTSSPSIRRRPRVARRSPLQPTQTWIAPRSKRESGSSWTASARTPSARGSSRRRDAWPRCTRTSSTACSCPTRPRSSWRCRATTIARWCSSATSTSTRSASITCCPSPARRTWPTSPAPRVASPASPSWPVWCARWPRARSCRSASPPRSPTPSCAPSTLWARWC